MIRYAFFLGCQIPMRLPNIEIATRKVFEKVGLEAVDLLGYSCCPEPVVSRLLDETAALVISAKNLTMAEDLGLNMMTLCNGCYETLAEANEILKRNSEIREKINGILRRYGREFKGKIEVKHVIEVLYEDVGLERIKNNIMKPQRMRVALHYGCHLHREYTSPDIMRKPNMMREIAAQTGVEIVDYGLERLCCGYPSMQADEEFSLKNRLLLKLSRIRGSGADSIVTACPACMIQFEMGQIMLRSYGIQYSVPCINLMELLALSFGVPYQELRLDLHRSPVLQLIQKMGVK
ncbi:MAG: CoB--CoM heterodisulfide reductase iron-sulfur subunit B family protein [Candidatus Bathyarchaeota archaeon]|nr:CoB--CoM heterodisulfide reductase iron-sulfur subunit B family protein [Candidatus Bathyarchaeota archaeon]